MRREAVVQGEADGALRWSGGRWDGHHCARGGLGAVSALSSSLASDDLPHVMHLILRHARTLIVLTTQSDGLLRTGHSFSEATGIISKISCGFSHHLSE